MCGARIHTRVAFEPVARILQAFAAAPCVGKHSFGAREMSSRRKFAMRDNTKKMGRECPNTPRSASIT
jgi:hypothetical protein